MLVQFFALRLSESTFSTFKTILHVYAYTVFFYAYEIFINRLLNILFHVKIDRKLVHVLQLKFSRKWKKKKNLYVS